MNACLGGVAVYIGVYIAIEQFGCYPTQIGAMLTDL